MSDTVDRIQLDHLVKDVYGKVANSPHGAFHFEVGRGVARKLGYPDGLLGRIPTEAVDSFAGVGYHFDLAALEPGNSVLDLGSGSGMDSFLAAAEVGGSGNVMGIDISEEQLAKARRLNNGSSAVVEFREARIDSLPFDAESFDAAISNGVINLVFDKHTAFKEISRVLRKGGRLAISDIVTEKALDNEIKCDATLWASCIGGAMQQDEYQSAIEDAGLEVIEIRENPQYQFLSESAREATDEYGVKSVSLLALKRS